MNPVNNSTLSNEQVPVREWRQSLCFGVLRIFQGVVPSADYGFDRSYTVKIPFPTGQGQIHWHLQKEKPIYHSNCT